MLSLEDRFEIMSLPARYGNAIDDRQWDIVRAIFTDDAVFEIIPYNIRLQGVEEIVAFMDKAQAHPLGHLMMNVVVSETQDSTYVRFRAIFPMNYDEHMDCAKCVRFGCYYDRVVKIDNVWRIKTRIFSRAPRDMAPTAVDLENMTELSKLFLKERNASISV